MCLVGQMRGACEREDLQLQVLTDQFEGADIIVVTPPGEDCAAAHRLFPEAVILCVPDSADSEVDEHWLQHAGPRLSLVWHDSPTDAKRRWQGSLFARRVLFDCATLVKKRLEVLLAVKIPYMLITKSTKVANSLKNICVFPP